MKIFQIGFNRCGTTTIHAYLCANGLKSVHWHNGWLALRMFKNLSNGDMLMDGYENFEAFSDMEYIDENGTYYFEGYKLFPYLATQYPDGVFILNTRNRETWIQSRFKLWRGVYAAQHKYLYRTKSDDELANIWRGEWDRHHRRVMEFFSKNRYRFFVCNIETDLPHILNEKIPELKLDIARYKVYKDNSVKNSVMAQYAKLIRLYIRKFERKTQSIYLNLYNRFGA